MVVILMPSLVLVFRAVDELIDLCGSVAVSLFSFAFEFLKDQGSILVLQFRTKFYTE